MIDTHCHLLSGLDDGPRSFNDSIRMARRLSEAGVELVVCTPHFNARFPTTVSAAAAALERLADAINTLGIPLGLRLAAELDPQFALTASAGEVRSRRLAPGFVLVELVPTTTADEIRRVVARLAGLGLTPVFAHPERCRAVQRKPSLLDASRSDGALVQVVAGSLLPAATAEVGRAAWSLVESGRAALVASDAHRPESSRLRLAPLADEISRRYGPDVAADLFDRAPARLLGMPVPGVEREPG